MPFNESSVHFNIMTQELSIVTINTWKCDGHYHQRIKLLGDQLSQLHPSVVLCQEVFQSEPADTLRYLADTLQMKSASAAAREKERIFDGEYINSTSGLGALSVFPVDMTTKVALPTDIRDGERIAQFVIIRVENEPILLINTHLTHLRDTDDLRKGQLDTILSHPLVKGQYKGIFLCGDLNCNEHSKAIQSLLHHEEFSIKNCRTSPEGQKAQDTRVSFDEATGEVIKASCIDFIFSIAHDKTPHLPLSEATVVLNNPDTEGIYPSDHFGVMATFDS